MPACGTADPEAHHSESAATVARVSVRRLETVINRLLLLWLHQSVDHHFKIIREVAQWYRVSQRALW
jgi:hypothetical protein